MGNVAGGVLLRPSGFFVAPQNQGRTSMQNGHAQNDSFPGMLQHQGPGETAEVLLITCTDPVLEETLLTEFCSVPLLLWRTPGPTIPPSGSKQKGVESMLQEALDPWSVREIIVCGHLPSGVIRSVADSKELSSLPPEAVAAIQAVYRLVKQKHGSLPPEQLHQAVVEENVLLQTANLRTYPAVLAAVAEQRVRLHSWIYDWQDEVLYVRGPGESSLLKRTQKFVAPTPGPLPYHDPCDIYLA